MKKHRFHRGNAGYSLKRYCKREKVDEMRVYFPVNQSDSQEKFADSKKKIIFLRIIWK